jgi:hypothetical protein
LSQSPSAQPINTKATVGKMKIITTWHCTEILPGEASDTTPREWLILAGPGEDLIFEVRLPRDRPTSLTSRQRGTSADDPDAPFYRKSAERDEARRLAAAFFFASTFNGNR